jgi:hypothetical protein
MPATSAAVSIWGAQAAVVRISRVAKTEKRFFIVALLFRAGIVTVGVKGNPQKVSPTRKGTSDPRPPS